MSIALCEPNVRGDACGNGVCDASGYACVCDAGYELDFLQRLHANCSLPTVAKQVLLALIGLLGVFAMAWSARELLRAQRRATALRLLRIAFTGGLFSAAYSLALGLEGGHGPASIILLILLYVTLAIVGVEQLLWSMISPIFAVSKQNSKPYTRAVRVGLLAVAVAFSGAWIAALVFLAQGRFREFNLAVSSGMVVVGCESFFIAVIVSITLKQLLHTIDGTRSGALKLQQIPSSPTNNNNNNVASGGVTSSAEDPVMRYRGQAKRMSQRVVALCLMVFSSALILVVLDFSLGVYPYRWILTMVICFGFPGFCIVLVEYCKRSLNKTSSRKGDTATAASRASKGSKVGDATDVMVVGVPGGSATIQSVDLPSTAV